MACRGADRRGFTLLEMLVALAMMSVLAASLYASLHIGFRARERAEAALEPVRAVGLAMELLRRDIASALPPTGVLAGAMLGEDRTADLSRGDTDSLVFHTASGDADEHVCDVRKVEFAVTESDDGAGPYALVRRVTTNLLAPEAPAPDEEVLCRSVRAFNLRYFDGADWLDSWDSSQQGNALPVAVEVTVVVGRWHTTGDEATDYEQVRVFASPCYQPPDERQGGTRVVRPTSR